MAQELALEFCIRQSALLEMLLQFEERFVKETHSFARLEKISQHLQKYQEAFQRELNEWQVLLEKAYAQPSAVKTALEELSKQFEQFQSYFQLKSFSISGREEVEKYLIQLQQKVSMLKQTLQTLDLKKLFRNMGEKMLVKHYEELGITKKIQWPRKLLHLLAGLFIVYAYLGMRGSLKTKLIIFTCFTVYATVCDSIRFISPRFNSLVMRDLKKFMRKGEATRLNSLTFYALSCLLVLLLFPKGIAILSVLFLAVSDTLASVVGIYWGKTRFLGGRFSLEGSLTFFVCCFGLSFFYPLLVPSFQSNLLPFALGAGLIGMLAEWSSAWLKLDDNFTIPLVSAFLLEIFIFFF